MESLNTRRMSALASVPTANVGVASDLLGSGWNRRTWLKTASLAGAGWLTPLASMLARADEQQGGRQRAQSVILLWMGGGASQLETFDPHPGKDISGGTQAIETNVSGVKLAAGLPRLAEQMDSISLIRNVVTREGDHERGTYLVKTGYSPLPVMVHPTLGAILCHALPIGQTDIPRHVSILPGQWYGRGGFLGDQFDAFKIYDPLNPVPDVAARVSDDRVQQRLDDLQVVENAFARGRMARAKATLHADTVARARTLMTSDQLDAFDVSKESAELRAKYGETPFGRACLTARRLTENGVRCVEVTLQGWDTHASNHDGCKTQNNILDSAFAALIADLKERGQLETTIVICASEFGRTPSINGFGGRDHWPGGFTVALAGGGIRGGRVLGRTDPDGARLTPAQGRKIADIHATILKAVGLDPTVENIAPGPRPIKLSEGSAIAELLA